MPRKKEANRQKLFNCPIRTRVTNKTFERLEKFRANTNCHSIGELARKILSNEKIDFFYHDVSLSAPMEEMALIRKEIKAIGHNINQQTHYFHICDSEFERAFHVLKTADLYSLVEAKTDRLLIIISKLAEIWLPKL